MFTKTSRTLDAVSHVFVGPQEELRQERMAASLESINVGINDLRSLINERLDNSVSGTLERTFSELTVRNNSVTTTGLSTHGTTTLGSAQTNGSYFPLNGP